MRRRYVAPALALAAGALGIIWWAPWSTSPEAIPRAREAFGTAREVHVLASVGVDPEGPAMRPLTSGESIEVWYDGVRHRTHVVVRRATKVALDVVDNGLEPPDVAPFGVPTLLWEFVTGYRPALTGGKYRVDRSAQIEGRRVLWLRAPTQPPEVEVAVDPVSYQAIWLRGSDSTLLIQLAVAETKQYDPADFLTAKEKKPRHL
jgi:hypothetical protein